MVGISKSDHIIIVGAGAFGLSTALDLSRRGYTNITVFEKDDEVPSRWSAANDLNKIMRAEYEDDFYTELTVEAARAWQTPLFAPYFHRVGFLHCVSGAAPKEAVDTLDRFQAAAERHSLVKKHLFDIKNAEDVKHHVWQFNDGELPGWKGYFNRFDGYTHSGNALIGVYRATRANGVRFFLGPDAGAVSEVVYENVGARRAKGIRTQAGKFHAAKLVIVAAGAHATRLVPEIGTNVVAKSWSVAHLHLSDEETAALRGIPVTYARDLGFFFEPDPKTNLLKLCPMGGGYINTNPTSGLSQPPEKLADSAILPGDDEKKLRVLLRQTLPALADRPFVKKSLCWFADTNDSDFIVDYVPNTNSSVVLLSGDSGHGFKMFPIVGKWITALLESPTGLQPVARWRWKNPSNAAKGGDWGGDVSWRLGNTKEFSELQASLNPKL